MNTINIEQLQPDHFYWPFLPKVALASRPNDIEVVQVSTVFGVACEFWTVAMMGSDEHFDLTSFEFYHKIPAPPSFLKQRTNLKPVSWVSWVSLTANR